LVAVFEPGGTRLWTSGGDSTVRVWDSETGSPVGEPLTLSTLVFSIKFLPRDRILLTQQIDSIIIDAKTHQVLERAPPHCWGADRIAVSPDGRRYAWPARDGTIKVWNTEWREEEFAFRGQPAFLCSMLFTHDGQRLVSVGYDSTIRVWGFSRPTDGKVVCRVRPSGGLAFSQDGKRIAVAATSSGSHGLEAGRVRIHDVESGRELLRLDALGEVLFGPNDQWLVTNRADGSATLWNPDTGEEIRRLYAPGHRSMRLALSPDFAELACGTNDGKILLWNLTNSEPPKILAGHEKLVTALVYHPDGSRLASCDRMGKVIEWNRQGEQVMSCDTKRALQRMVYSPNGQRIAVAGGSQSVSIRDIRTGAETQQLHGHTAWVWGLAFTPDSSRIITSGADDTVRMWDAASGQELIQLPGIRGLVTHIAISKDGRRIAAGDSVVRMWEID
jgi:WD40 repeat protein